MPNENDLDVNLRLHQLFERLGRIHEARPVPELSRREFITLQVLRYNSEAGSIRMGDLARLLEVPLPALSKMMQSLEPRGLVRREIDPTDRRFTLASITPDGLALAQKAEEHNDRNTRAVFDALGEEDSAAFFRITTRLVELAEEQTQKENANVQTV